MGWVIRIIFDPNTRQWGGGGFEGGDPWIILGPFWTILLIALSTLCQWYCGLVDHFLEVTLLEQVNFHFGFIFFKTHCWSKMLLRDTYIWKLHLWIIF